MKSIHPNRLLLLFLLLQQPLFIWANSISDNANSLSFLRNIGQIKNQYGTTRTDIEFKLAGGSINLFIGSGILQYQWSKPLQTQTQVSPAFKPTKVQDSVLIYRVDVSLEGRNPFAVAEAENISEYTERYYKPGIKVDNNVAASYQKITYTDIYPGIDWVLYIKDKMLKYDFIVHPGADPSVIKMKYSGSDVSVTNTGDLLATHILGTLTEHSPVAYESETGKLVTSSFTLGDNKVGFNISPYDGTLVIDPAVDWSTYYVEGIQTAVATDANSNVVMGGYTTYPANLATIGAHQTVFAGAADAYIAKFNSQGQQLWATFYGGSDYDRAYSIATDGQSSIYLSGETYSDDLFMLNSFVDTNAGDYDAFLAKFDSAGVLKWSTYYGEFHSEYESVVACDASNNVYLAGGSEGNGALSTPGSFQPAINGLYDGFLTKFNSSGARIWSTYFGGNDYDGITGLKVDAGGNIFVQGYTYSTSGLATPGAYQTTYGGSVDVFVAKFNTAGQRLWASYYGGDDYDYGFGMAIDPWGDCYIAGSAGSDNNIATPGSFKSTKTSYLEDGFLAKFSDSGQIIWATYYGGFEDDNATAVACDVLGRPYIAGLTYSTAGIATTSGYQTANAGGADAYLVRFDTAGHRKWASYFGGPADESLLTVYSRPSLATDQNGYLYLAGYTQSSSGIATPNSFQPTAPLGGSFLARFAMDTMVYIEPSFNTDNQLCIGEAYVLPFHVLGAYNPGNVFTVQLSNASGSFSNPTTLASIAGTSSDTIFDFIPITGIAAGNNYRFRIISSDPADTSANNGAAIKISEVTTPTVSISASPGTNVILGTPVTFTASSSNQGNAPQYQWKKNGVLMPSTTNQYVSNSLVDGDVITVSLISSLPCANPDTVVSNSLTMTITTSIESFGAIQPFSISPNPNAGKFRIISNDPRFQNKELQIEIRNGIGQIVYQHNFEGTRSIDQNINLSSYTDGLYMLKVTCNGIQYFSTKILKAGN